MSNRLACAPTRERPPQTPNPGAVPEPHMEKTDVWQVLGTASTNQVNSHCLPEAGPLSRTLSPRLALVAVALTALFALAAIPNQSSPAQSHHPAQRLRRHCVGGRARSSVCEAAGEPRPLEPIGCAGHATRAGRATLSAARSEPAM
jgi:hypothetical protein